VFAARSAMKLPELTVSSAALFAVVAVGLAGQLPSFRTPLLVLAVAAAGAAAILFLLRFLRANDEHERQIKLSRPDVCLHGNIGFFQPLLDSFRSSASYSNLLRPVYHGEHELRTLKELARSYLTISKDLERVMSRLRLPTEVGEFLAPGSAFMRRAIAWNGSALLCVSIPNPM
jgi:hypothetical protein